MFLFQISTKHNNMLRSLIGLSKCTIESSVFIQSRNYAVPKRKLIRKEYFVYKPKMKSRYKGNPFPRLKVILLEDVENLGMKGDLVEVKRGRVRNDLIPNKLALYATEENLNKFGIDSVKIADSTPRVPLNVLKYLKKSEINLVTPLLDDIHEETRHDWMITRHNIAEYFHRHAGLQVPISCMDIVDSKDNIIKQTGSYVVEVTINNSVTVPVPLNVCERSEEGEDNEK